MDGSQEMGAVQVTKDTDSINSEVEIKDLNTDIEPRGIYDGDEYQLARLGKKQILGVGHLC